jgi:hypothetical protein
MMKDIHLTQTTINHAMHINVAISSLNTFPSSIILRKAEGRDYR